MQWQAANIGHYVVHLPAREGAFEGRHVGALADAWTAFGHGEQQIGVWKLVDVAFAREVIHVRHEDQTVAFALLAVTTPAVAQVELLPVVSVALDRFLLGTAEHGCDPGGKPE